MFLTFCDFRPWKFLLDTKINPLMFGLGVDSTQQRICISKHQIDAVFSRHSCVPQPFWCQAPWDVAVKRRHSYWPQAMKKHRWNRGHFQATGCSLTICKYERWMKEKTHVGTALQMGRCTGFVGSFWFISEPVVKEILANKTYRQQSAAKNQFGADHFCFVSKKGVDFFCPKNHHETCWE